MPVRKRYEADISPVSEWLTVTAAPPLPRCWLPIIDRASICPCPVGKADPASAHVPLVKALRYLAYPCCLRSRLRMEVFGLCPTFHVSVPLLVFSSEWPAGSLGPPSRKPPPSRSRATQHLCEMTLFDPLQSPSGLARAPYLPVVS